jgi:phosphoribosylformylglycinamidine synthase
MKISLTQTITQLCQQPNTASQQPIFEKYDKNVQGNTMFERGHTAAAITAPFRDFPELSESESMIAIAIATGGNANIAKISAKAAARSAIAEAVVKLSCVGAEPLAATDCLNFGNPEKAPQMSDFVTAIEGLKESANILETPFVSGNVSFYNESSGHSIPPSALVSVFGRVETPETPVPMAFPDQEKTIFCIGARTEDLGGSTLLNMMEKPDHRIPALDLSVCKNWTTQLRQCLKAKHVLSAQPIGNGGLVMAVLTASFKSKNLGAEISIPNQYKDMIPGFLFGEALGVIITTDHPEEIQSSFGEQAIKIGKTTSHQSLQVNSGDQELVNMELAPLKNDWNNTLRAIF